MRLQCPWVPIKSWVGVRQVREVRRFEKQYVIETRFVAERELTHLATVRSSPPPPPPPLQTLETLEAVAVRLAAAPCQLETTPG